MSKELSFIITIFLSLVAFNWMLSALPSFISTAPGIARGQTEPAYVTQGYGRTSYSSHYPNGWNNGIDLAEAYGTPIHSPSDGTVIATGNQDDFCYRRGFGKYIAVKDETNGLVLWYAHLEK